MGVNLWTYGNHSIPFEGRRMTEPQQVIERLNALHLEGCEFLQEACLCWYTPSEQDSAERVRQKEESLKQCLQLKSWRLTSEEDSPDIHSVEYYLEGPSGIEINVLKHHIRFSGLGYRYGSWYNRGYWLDSEEQFLRWRNNWRSVFRQIVCALGGEYVMYYPDSMFKLADFIPTEKDSLTLDELIEFTQQNYPYCVDTFLEADALYLQDVDEEGLPFVVDRFEDLQK